ncbi:MAG: helix-turn-helix transcriptional regulator [Balneolaceae bacterium]
MRKSKPIRVLDKTLLRLSRREGEVLIKVAEGKKNQRIAEELFLSKRTIENTRSRICNKLDLKGRGALEEWIKRNYK